MEDLSSIMAKGNISKKQIMAKGNISKKIKASFFDSALRFSFVPGERKEPPFLFCFAWFRRTCWPRNASDKHVDPINTNNK